MVVVAVLDPDAIAVLAPGPGGTAGWQDRFANAWRQVAATVDESIASVAFSQEVVTLVPVDPEARVAAGHARSTGSSRRTRDRGGGRIAFSGGVSRVAGDLGAARPSGRRSAPSRSVVGSTAVGRSPGSTSSACTGCSRSCRTPPS